MGGLGLGLRITGARGSGAGRQEPNSVPGYLWQYTIELKNNSYTNAIC